ncbi:Protein of unknown function [Halopenitus malekzadehii]|uniref:DUF1102 domain-containing protein n=1 Tax=Halopenitus malekzadehii TaxID=1267564 RepID=A0A1H6IDV4_9EURY|nr:DUF1102 domain-containing protein [Halopenitus malekzadehii]SEH45329.1 Protein of unknown function [Halopenitus malekzadehii]
MARPKGKLLALVLVFGAITVVTATGAFTTVEAERTAEVNVAGDANALVGLEPGSGAGADGYVDDSGDEIQIDLSGGSDSQGVNLNATTEFDNILQISNNGENEVNISVNTNGDNEQYVSVYNGTDYDDSSQEITNGTNNATVPSGEMIEVSIRIDITGDDTLSKNDELLSNIEIVAESTGN